MNKTILVNTNRTVLLKGEGENQHVLYGDAVISGEKDYKQVDMRSDGILKHEDPDGRHAEHKSILIQQGEWVMGMQVEYDPFSVKSLSDIGPSSDPYMPGSIVPVWD